jgi:predicted metal-dependent enzyme (double-stranded beta helix superfamily)
MTDPESVDLAEANDPEGGGRVSRPPSEPTRGAGDAVAELARSVEAVLDRYGDGTDIDEAAAIAALWPAMERFLERADELADDARVPDTDGGAIGHLLHADPLERFHILSVVFPPGTSSGIHEHGCWGIIGYVAGLDEETRFHRTDGGTGDDDCVLEEVERTVHEPGTISRLLPPDEMHHRVRNPGDIDGVSVHVLCKLPESHPHKFWDRDHHRLLPFPFRVLSGNRVRADVDFS